MSSVDPSRATVTRPPWTVRVAAWSAHHRWPVAAVWFVATIGLFALSLAAGGTRSVEAVSNNERAKYEAGEAGVVYAEANAAAAQQEAASQQFLLIVSSPDQTVDDPAFKAAITDITTRMTALEATVDGKAGPVFGTSSTRRRHRRPKASCRPTGPRSASSRASPATEACWPNAWTRCRHS